MYHPSNLPAVPALQEEEADYQACFPNQHVLWDDLAGDDNPAVFDEDAPPSPAAPATAGSEAAAQAAAYSVRELVTGEVLDDIVAVHAAAFAGSGGDGGCNGPVLPAQPCGPRAFLCSYELGTQLLRDAGLALPAWVDDVTATGHLYAACCRLAAMAARPLERGAGVDMQAGCVEEAALVAEPVAALRARLLELLDQWPEHPLLLQLAGIAGGQVARSGCEARPAVPAALVRETACRPTCAITTPPFAHPPRPPGVAARSQPTQGGADRSGAAAGAQPAVGGDSCQAREPGARASPAGGAGHALAPPRAGQLAVTARPCTGTCGGRRTPGVLGCAGSWPWGLYGWVGCWCGRCAVAAGGRTSRRGAVSKSPL